MNRLVRMTALSAVCVALTSCGTVAKLNPFHQEGAKLVAAKGERIPVLAANDTLEPAEGLKGAAFSIGEPMPVQAWPLPGGNDAQAVENVKAAPDFKIAWRHDIGMGSGRKAQITAPPVAVDGKVFTMDGQAEIQAVDAKTGRLAWRANLRPAKGRDREAWGGGLAVSDGKLFVTSGYRFVAALDSASGKVLWKKAITSPIHSAPTVTATRIFAVDLDNQVLAFDPATGEETWSYQALVESARILKASSPAVSGDEVIAPFSSGELVALSANNGNALWDQSLSHATRTNALSEIRDIAGRPAIYKGEVFAASQSGVFAAVDLHTGAPKWQLPVSSIDSPWPAGDVVYIISEAGELIAAARESGQVYWIQDLNKNRSRKEGGFARLGRHVVRPLWAGPILAGDRLIAVNNWGDAVAFDAHTGAQRTTLKIGGGGAYIAPIAYDGLLYVVTDDGHLVAIR